MTREITAEQATAAVADHGEGPVWDASRGVLASVDMLRGDLLTARPRWRSAGASRGRSDSDSLASSLTVDLLRDGAERTEVRRRHVGDVLAALRPRARGGWVVALERGFGLLDEPGSAGEGEARSLGELWSDPGIRMNEGACDPAGGFWCGSMAYDAAPGRGALFRLAPDGSVTTMLTGVTVSNGLCWTPDGSRAYYVDNGRLDVLTVDLSAPAVTSREHFVDVEGGTADGLTVDADGGVWVALWGGSAVHRYTPDGTLDTIVHVPTTHPTACTFAGPELDELWITTSATGAGGPDGRAGALYRCVPGVRGLEPLPYRG